MIDLDATRWQAIRQQFEALLRLSSGDRSARLARIGARDPEMGSALAALRSYPPVQAIMRPSG